MEYLVKALHFTPKIPLDKIRQEIPGGIIRNDSGELHYKLDGQSYLSIFSYGSIVFFNFSEEKQQEIIKKLSTLLSCDTSLAHWESFKVIEDPLKESEVFFDHLFVTKIDKDIAWIIMFTLAQSVALDYYMQACEQMRQLVLPVNNTLEIKGTINLKGKKLHQFIGRTLKLKNSIAQDIYVFDTPKIIWKNESLNWLSEELSRELDIHIRYRSIQDNLNIVKDNLDLFLQVDQHKYSSLLEWIIILLIAFEIGQVLIKELIH